MADVAEIPPLKAEAKQDVITKLQQEVYSMQRLKKSNDGTTRTIGPFETAFPNQSFQQVLYMSLLVMNRSMHQQQTVL